jgi:hypothetical protein
MKHSHLTVKVSLLTLVVGGNNNVAGSSDNTWSRLCNICGILVVAILSLELPVD